MSEWQEQPRLSEDLGRLASEAEVDTGHRQRLRGMLAADAMVVDDPRPSSSTQLLRRSGLLLAAALLVAVLGLTAWLGQSSGSIRTDPASTASPPSSVITRPEPLTREALCRDGHNTAIDRWSVTPASSSDGSEEVEIDVLSQVGGPIGRASDRPTFIQLGTSPRLARDTRPPDRIVSAGRQGLWFYVPALQTTSEATAVASALLEASCTSATYVVETSGNQQAIDGVLCAESSGRRYSGAILLEADGPPSACARTIPTLAIHDGSELTALWSDAFGCIGPATEVVDDSVSRTLYSECEVPLVILTLRDGSLTGIDAIGDVLIGELRHLN